MTRQLMVIISCSLGFSQLCYSQGVVDLPSAFLVEGESIKAVKSGLKFCEGPVTDDDGNVYFSEMGGQNRIWTVTPEGDALVLLDGFPGSNGIDMDPNGYLIAVGEGKVQRICPEEGTGEVLIKQRSFGKLSDITVSSRNHAYFTDNKDEIFYFSPGREVKPIPGVNKPNGVYLVEERRVLLVTAMGDGALLEFEVKEDGTLGKRTKRAELPMPDGLCMDANCNIYVASWSTGTLYVFNSKGKQQGTITLTGDSNPEGNVSNCTFGGKDNKTLYITGDGGLYSLRMNIPGRRKFAQPPQYMNELSPEEEAAGYELMFNGENLDGWRTYGQDEIVGDAWKVMNDELHGARIETSADTIGKRTSIIHRKLFHKNFDLKLEWACSLYGNSGIFYRYLDTPRDEWKDRDRTGPEVQIKGPEYRIPNNKKWNVGRRGVPGACYQIKGPEDGVEFWHNAWGQYNEFRIVCFEKKVAHYGNGLKLLEYEIDSPYWKEMFENSIYARSKKYGEVHDGSIRLEHKNKFGVLFRNIRIKALEKDPWQGRELGALPDRLSLSENLPLRRTE